MKTRGPNGRVVFIVLSVLQFQENNEYRLVNSRVKSIVLKCLETLVEHEPRVNEITPQSTIVFRFEFMINNCGNNMVFIVYINKKCCDGSLFIVSSVYILSNCLITYLKFSSLPGFLNSCTRQNTAI